MNCNPIKKIDLFNLIYKIEYIRLNTRCRNNGIENYERKSHELSRTIGISTKKY
ncbi:hypothetical protein [Acanthamoeba polyphaga mimivirus]|nr:hypothetical protein [Acanthamoeba polyphaga mimivirus]